MSEEMFASVSCLFMILGYGIPATIVYYMSRDIWHIEYRIYRALVAAFWPFVLIFVTLFKGDDWRDE